MESKVTSLTSRNIIKKENFKVIYKFVRRFSHLDELLNEEIKVVRLSHEDKYNYIKSLLDNNTLKFDEFLSKRFFAKNKLNLRLILVSYLCVKYNLDTSNKFPSFVIRKRLPSKKLKLTHEFYSSDVWFELRHIIIKLYGRKCMKCGMKEGKIHIDHIFPRSKFKGLATNIYNLQVLCERCNIDKSNKNTDDFRTENQKAICIEKYNKDYKEFNSFFIN